jgi:hypothetical protein
MSRDEEYWLWEDEPYPELKQGMQGWQRRREREEREADKPEEPKRKVTHDWGQPG